MEYATTRRIHKFASFSAVAAVILLDAVGRRWVSQLVLAVSCVVMVVNHIASILLTGASARSQVTYPPVSPKHGKGVDWGRLEFAFVPVALMVAAAVWGTAYISNVRWPEHQPPRLVVALPEPPNTVPVVFPKANGSQDLPEFTFHDPDNKLMQVAERFHGILGFGCTNSTIYVCYLQDWNTGDFKSGRVDRSLYVAFELNQLNKWTAVRRVLSRHPEYREPGGHVYMLFPPTYKDKLDPWLKKIANQPGGDQAKFRPDPTAESGFQAIIPATTM